MNYCHNLAGGSIDTGEGHVEYFRVSNALVHNLGNVFTR